LNFDRPGHNVVADKGVYMSINLHCALLDVETQRILLAVKSNPAGAPAAEQPFRRFEITADSVREIK
jgi:hypothetical protein